MIPLKKAGMKLSISNLLKHWYGLVKYANKILSLTRVSYLVTWRKIFKTSRSKGWSDVLFMIRLLFIVSVSNAKLERMFSKLKRVKTKKILENILENILAVMPEGSSSETFDPMSATKKWNIDSVRLATEKKEPRSYKSCNSAEVNVKPLSDDDS